MQIVVLVNDGVIVAGGKCLMDEVEDEGRCVKGFLGCVFGNGIGYKWEI